jgi:glycosyltransferase involved in cell wall biosynthesis
MSKKPLVSIVTITYNHEKYIRETLESFLAQQVNFQFEIIIADDCSTDTTPKIISEYAKKYPEIFKPILRKKNIGAVPNSVSSLQVANGTYVALCEGDDYWTDPKKLQKQVDFLESNKDFALCFHPVRVFFENEEQKEYISPDVSKQASFTTDELIRRNFIQTCSVMYRRRDYNNLPNNVMPFDWYLHLYHAQQGKIGFIEDIMGAYRRHAGGAWWGSQNSLEAVLKKYSLQWIALNAEALKLYGSDKGRRELIEGALITLYNLLADVDKREKKALLKGAFEAYPDYALLYADNLRQQVEQLKVHSKEQSKIIDHYVGLSHILEDRVKVAEQQIQRLKSNLIVRLGVGAKKYIRKIVK